MIIVALLVICGPNAADARVVRVTVRERKPFAGGRVFGEVGAYEHLIGRIEFAVDPNAAANANIVDLKRAADQAFQPDLSKVPDGSPANGSGQAGKPDLRVTFSSDFELLKPADPSRGNHRLLYEVNNRGNKLMLGALCDRPSKPAAAHEEAGNGFLMRQGYSLLWCGWNANVAAGDGKLTIRVPIATDSGRTITGLVYSEICVNKREQSQPFDWGGSDCYPAVVEEKPKARLTKRQFRRDPPVEIPQAKWDFARWEKSKAIPDAKSLYLADGFEPGWIYELVYPAKEPRVVGLGLAAIRDSVSYFHHAAQDDAGGPNLLAGHIEHCYVFGISQSARVIHHFLYEGFNLDEAGKPVFTGAFSHVGGAGRGMFNSRFAQSTRHGSPHEDNLYPSDSFPFATTETSDPIAGKSGDAFAMPRTQGALPKVFFVDTSTEYWCRGASLLHTDVEGKRDVPVDPMARVYFIAGGQHGVSASTTPDGYQHQRNILDYRPVLRALLVDLDQWVSRGTTPPASRYPRIDDGTLVPIDAWKKTFPKIGEARLPRAAYAPYRLDLGPRWDMERIADNVPPKIGEQFHTLVPAVDSDGNELAGIRLPELAVPIAAYTGWNLRGPSIGAEGELTRLTGSYFPFAKTEAERVKQLDPRPPIDARYPTREAYVSNVVAAAKALCDARFLLDEDLPEYERAAKQRLR